MAKRSKQPRPPIGGGGMMKQIQQLQEQLLAAQEALADETISASAGGGVVKATVTGDQQLRGIEIDPSLLEDGDVEMLQDLILAAVNDAMKNAPAYDPNHSKVGIVLPSGLGLKYVINQDWSMGAEFGIRFSTTDYLDGYSHPNYSKANDLYYFGFINGIYRIRTSRSGVPILFGRQRRTFL